MPDMDNLLRAIDAAEENAYGSDTDSSLEDARAKSIDYYLGTNRTPAPEGRSQVVDRSVYETIQWMMPSLCRIFANGDDVVELPPVGPEDEEGAKQEAQYLNFILLQKNPWFEVFRTAALDALLIKAGYLYAYRDKRRRVEMEKYERQTPESLALLLQDKDVEVLETNEYPDPDYVEQPPQQIVDSATGQPVMLPALPPPMLYDVSIRRAKEDSAYCVKALPPERCKISELTEAWHLRECPYFEYWDFCTLSDLRAEGYDVPDDIADEVGDDTQEDYSRDVYGESRTDDETDPAMRRVKKRMIWIRHDYDEDGIAEMQYVLRVGNEILYREEVNKIPVGVLCPDPLPHRHIGLSVADTVMDISDIKMSIMRNGLDNLALSNNPRTFANGSKVNLDDLLISRPGSIVRMKDGAAYGTDVVTVPMPFVFPQAMEALEYMDSVRENRTGTNRYFTGIDQNAMNKTATGIQQLSTMAAQRVEQIARCFAFGIEDTCAILHELVLKSGHKAEVVKLRGKWVEVDPSTWKSRTDFRISVGFSAGNKDAQVARLMMIGQQQKEAAAMGLPIASPQNMYETALELTKASDFSTPERFWTDPATLPPAQPPQPDPTVLAVEQLRAQTELQKVGTTATQQDNATQVQAAIDKYKTDKDNETKLIIEQMKANTSAQLEDFKTNAQAGLKYLDHMQTGEREQRSVEVKNKPAMEVAQQVQQLAGKLEEAVSSLQSSLATVLTAKRQIRRGKDGKAEGVDLVDDAGNVILSQNVERGPDGRVVGAQ